MDVAGRHALLVSADHGRFTRFVPVLQRAGLEVQRVLRGSAALKVAETVGFDLLLIVAPLEDMLLRDFIRAVRAPSSPSREVGVVVLCEGQDLDTARTLLSTGVNRVLPLDSDDQVLIDTVTVLLNVAPRRRLHAVLKADLALGQRRRLVMHQTENLSLTGALVRGEPPYPVGTRFNFEIVFPGVSAPIRGTAEVVRHTNLSREQVKGFGATFVSFAGDGRQSLESALARAS
jgi:DNA-binding NarL/FixJ family response regulator